MDHILILESEEYRENKQEVFDEVLDFVGLPPYSLAINETEYHGSGEQVMTKGMRRRLNMFFRPYNARLHHLLEPLGVEISWAKEAARAYWSARERMMDDVMSM